MRFYLNIYKPMIRRGTRRKSAAGAEELEAGMRHVPSEPGRQRAR